MSFGSVRGLVCPLLSISVLTGAEVAVASPVTYYVSNSGADTNPGTESQPFATIQRGADVAAAGDTVVVEDGTYTGTGTGTACSERPVVCLSRSGTAGAWITFRARHAGRARVDGQQNVSTHGFFFRNNASYIAIDGFEITGMGLPNGAASGSAHGVMVDVGHDVLLTRLHIHDIGRTCSTTTYGFTGVFVRVPRVTISKSVFHDIGRYLAGEQGCPSTLTPHFDHAIYASGSYYSATTPGASDLLISNNVFTRLDRGWGVHLYPGTLPHVAILNNTFAFPHPSQVGQIIIAASTSDSRIENNIFYAPNTAAIRYYSGTQTNLEVRNNLVYSASLLSATPAGVALSGNVSADPVLVNTTVAPYDFHLTVASPAVSIGLTLTEVSDDLDGIPRPVGAYDLGAYQLFGAPLSEVDARPLSEVDVTPPVVAFTSPADGATVRKDVIFRVAASDSGGVTDVTFSVDGHTIGSDETAPYTASFSFRKPGTGAHVVTAVARDAAGNSATASIVVWR